jgi:methylthioribulose-1-phosphate dehydratase
MLTKVLKQKLAELIRRYNSKGWSPATSTNYSFKDEDGAIWVSRSGIDKSEFTENDFITVDYNANAIGDFVTQKPSAETLIHCNIYKMFPETTVILHSHSVFPILISEKNEKEVTFQGYEILKGFEGQTTHDAKVSIPIYDNSQDMVDFTSMLRNNQSDFTNHCFIIRKHGTYAWGTTLFEAKRHLETLEYLCEVTILSSNK